MATDQPPLLRQVPEIFSHLPRTAILALDRWRPPCRRSSLISEVQQLTNHVAFFFDSTIEDDDSLIPRHRISWSLSVSLPGTFGAEYSPGEQGDVLRYIVPRVRYGVSLPPDTCISERFATSVSVDIRQFMISLCKLTGAFMVEGWPQYSHDHFQGFYMYLLKSE